MNFRTNGPQDAGSPFAVAPKVGLIGMLLVFAVVLAGVFSAGLFTDEEPVTATEPAAAVETRFVPDEELVGILPEESLRSLEAQFHDWFMAEDRQPIYDGRAEDEAEWVEYLLDYENWRRIRGLPEHAHGSLENVPDVLDEPAPYRGRLVRVWGRIEAVESVELALPSGARAAWITTVVDQAGTSWTMTGLSPPPERAEVGTWVKGYGVFTKLWPLPDRSVRALHVLLTRELVPTYKPVTFREPLTEWLELVKDDKLDPESAGQIEEVPLYGMLNYVRQLGPEGYLELRDVETLSIHNLPDALPLVDENVYQRYRFQPVRFPAAVAHRTFGTEGDLRENVGNIDWVYSGYVLDDRNRFVRFISPFPAEHFELEGNTRAMVEGFFLERVVVDPENSERYWQPILIGTVLEPVPVETMGVDSDTVLVLVGGGSVVVFLLMVFVIYRNKQERARFEERWRRRREESV